MVYSFCCFLSIFPSFFFRRLLEHLSKWKVLAVSQFTQRGVHCYAYFVARIFYDCDNYTSLPVTYMAFLPPSLSHNGIVIINSYKVFFSIFCVIRRNEMELKWNRL